MRRRHLRHREVGRGGARGRVVQSFRSSVDSEIETPYLIGRGKRDAHNGKSFTTRLSVKNPDPLTDRTPSRGRSESAEVAELRAFCLVDIVALGFWPAPDHTAVLELT